MDPVALVATISTPQAAMEISKAPEAVSWLQLRADLAGEIPAEWLRTHFDGKLLYTFRSTRKEYHSELYIVEREASRSQCVVRDKDDRARRSRALGLESSKLCCGRRLLEKPRTQEDEKSDDNRTENESEDHHRPEVVNRQKGIASREPGILARRLLHGFFDGNPESCRHHREQAVYKENPLNHQKSM